MDKIISQGAEAIIEQRGNEIIKKRISKFYRIKEIDEKVRKLRTRSEAKILEKAGKVIPIPKVISVDEKSKEIVMENINGKRLSDNLNSFSIEKQKQICEEIGNNISKIHEENIIHGDLTPSNMILANSIGRAAGGSDRGNNFKVYFIDFGLGFISSKAEDKAVDLHLLKEAFEAGFAKNWETLFNEVKKGYQKNYSDAGKILERLKAVEKRGRYKQGS